MAVPHTGAPAAIPITDDASLRNLSAEKGRFKGEPSFDLMAYGAAGDGSTDDTAAIQDAIDAAAVSGGIVNGSSKTYKVTATLTLASNVKLRDMILDGSSITTSDTIVEAVGDTETAVLLSGDATQGDTSISVVSSAGIAENDWLLVSSTGVFGSTSQPKGEIVRVASVSSGSITLYDPLCDSYATANAAQYEKLNFVENIVIERVRIIGPADDTLSIHGIYLDKCRDVLISDSSISRTHWFGVALRDCVAARVIGCQFDLIEKSGLAYGIGVLWACQDVAITACTAQRMRPLVTVGGGTGRPGVPRRITVTGCVVSQSMASGFNAHPVGEDINFIGNIVNGSDDTGITYQAASGVIANNTIRDTTSNGIKIQPLTEGPHDIICEGNRVSNPGSSGILYITSASWTNHSGVTISNNSVEDSATIGIDVDCSASAVSGAAVSGNRVRGATTHSINIRSVTGLVCANNIVHHAGSGNPLRIWSVDDSVVAGNSFISTNSSVHGISTVSPVTDSVIVGNRVVGCNRGVSLVAGANNNIVTGNNLRGNTTALLDSGTSNTTTGNVTA